MLTMQTADAERRLATYFGVRLLPLAPIDAGDWCAHCGKGEATVEDNDFGDRYCDAVCALAGVQNKYEAMEQRCIERYYGG